jgi:cbb3-type cytochrome oxidase maturation protein
MNGEASMRIVYLLLPMALGLAGVFVAGFAWMVRRGQFDDLETPAHRILIEDEGEET